MSSPQFHPPRALITGATGQDGAYLAELLLREGWEVFGVTRPGGAGKAAELRRWLERHGCRTDRFRILEADLTKGEELRKIFDQACPEQVYHLAGPSRVNASFESPQAVCDFICRAASALLETVRTRAPRARFFFASSSEVFGVPPKAPQDESVPFAPRSPYGCAKAFGTHLTRVFRESYGLFACSGILYNHESPRRSEQFVTQKICRAAAAIRLGLQTELRLGNLDARRDWGHAADYVRAMRLMLQRAAPEDFVIAAGQSRRVRDVLEAAFSCVGLDWRPYVKQDPRLYRPSEPVELRGDAGKARRLLGWTPAISFEEMIREMTDAALGKLSEARLS